MVELLADDPVPGYPGHKILTGGTYDHEDLVQVYRCCNPGIPEIAFRVAYIVGLE